MIEVKDLGKSFGQIDVLKGISLKIGEGEIYGLIGRSGAGKSTLLRCINGLESYDHGSLKVDGIEVKDLEGKELREFRKNIGMIFQSFSLMERKTVYENIALPMVCWGYNSDKIDKRVKELVELVGIQEKINDRPRTLSGGQKQRVAIARALSMEPKILLCDEATSALDPRTSTSILDLLKEINRTLGITIVVVTHQMEVVRQVCSKVALLEKGVLTADGSVEEIFLKQPQLLKNFMGEEKTNLPQEGKNIRIVFEKGDFNRPIVSDMAKKLDIDILLVGGKFENYGDDVLGSIIINIDTHNEKLVSDYLSKASIYWEVIDNE